MQGGKPAGEDLRAIAVEQIDGARAVLVQEELPVAKRVHEARKHLKKARAVLRLLRAQLGELYTAANRRLRDTGRRLSAARDATVVRQTFESVVAPGVDGADRTVLDTIGGRLRERADAAELEGGSFAAAAAKVDAELAAAREAALGWDLADYGSGDFARACAKNYRLARRAMRRVEKKRTAERCHEWRKRVKEDWYHMRLLDHPRREALDALGDLLGHANDLAVLSEVLTHQDVRDAALELRVETLRSSAIGDALESVWKVYGSKPKEFEVDLLDSLSSL